MSNAQPAGADAVELLVGPDGREVCWLARGPEKGRPVIYLHGAPGSRLEQLWVPDETLARFGVRLISIDRPGYGGTAPLAGSRIARVQDVLTVCDVLGIDRFAVVGVSSGGSYALTLAAIAGERVDRVVLSSGQVPYVDDETLSMLQAEQRAELPQLRAGRTPDLEEEFRVAQAELLADPVGALEQPMATLSPVERRFARQDWFIAMLARDVAEGVRNSHEGYLEDALSSVRPFEADVERVSCPVRAVHGSADDWEPVANLRQVLATVPDAQLVLLEGLNHFGPLMYPDLVLSLCVGSGQDRT